ncbi:MAG: hypothetical protein ABWY80_06140 [Acidimicrobiia bacterium]
MDFVERHSVIASLTVQAVHDAAHGRRRHGDRPSHRSRHVGAGQRTTGLLDMRGGNVVVGTVRKAHPMEQPSHARVTRFLDGNSGTDDGECPNAREELTASGHRKILAQNRVRARAA